MTEEGNERNRDDVEDEMIQDSNQPGCSHLIVPVDGLVTGFEALNVQVVSKQEGASWKKSWRNYFVEKEGSK